MLNAEPSTFLEITFRETYIKEASTAMALVFDCEMSVFKGKKSIGLFIGGSFSAHRAKLCTQLTKVQALPMPFFAHYVFLKCFREAKVKGGG